MVRRTLILGYGAVAYVAFLAVFSYTVGFVANSGVPKGIDDGSPSPVALAVLVDAGLLTLFAMQHSIMARPWFKRWWIRFVPASIERSTFVLAASLVLAVLLWQWRPLPAEVWSVEGAWSRAALWGLYGFGWLMVVGSTFLIDHFDLFGLRQVVTRVRERPLEPIRFRQPLLYRLVRHPIMVGFLIAFWAAPDMSAGRILFVSSPPATSSSRSGSRSATSWRTTARHTSATRCRSRGSSRGWCSPDLVETTAWTPGGW
jgi:methanethiol S-methyltransferase